MESSMVGPWVYVNYTYYAQLLKKPGYASMLYISTTQHDPNTIARVTSELETNFSSAGLRTNSINPVSDLREAINQQFNVLVLFLVVMAMILALVGGFGLIGTMSLNVLERRREIGVMRAVGASRGAVYRIVTTEGALIGVISWGIASLLAFPLSRFMSDMVGQGFLQIPLKYSFSSEGVILWLGLIVLLSIIASSLPALNATRFTVRDLLAYE
jgi:putative ABC transport system permease protein